MDSVTDDDTPLPFTGFTLLTLVAVGLLTLAAGALLHRRTGGLRLGRSAT